MEHKKPSLKELASLCTQPGPEDGLDPRELAKSSSLANSKPGYKDIGVVMRAQKELTRIIRRLRPILSYKGGR